MQCENKVLPLHDRCHEIAMHKLDKQSFSLHCAPSVRRVRSKSAARPFVSASSLSAVWQSTFPQAQRKPKQRDTNPINIADLTLYMFFQFVEIDSLSHVTCCFDHLPCSIRKQSRDHRLVKSAGAFPATLVGGLGSSRYGHNRFGGYALVQVEASFWSGSFRSQPKTCKGCNC